MEITPTQEKETHDVVAEHDGEVIGMMVTFPIEEASENNSKATTELKELSDEPDILAPYSMEAPGTWYICALALFPEFRGQGLGTQFLSIARQQAQEKGFQELSLLCFEQNTGAMKLYQRNGFKVIDRAAIVPHKLIHCTGDVLLMTTPPLPIPLSPALVSKQTSMSFNHNKG